MSDSVIEAQYLKMEYLLSKSKDEALYILETEMRSREIKVHAIHSRLKTVDSIKRKIERLIQQGSGVAKLENLGDLVGIRVVCLFRSDISKIGDVIRNIFVVISEDDKVDGADVASFGYQSVHFVVKIREDFTGPRYNDIKELKIEIQLRTIAMDAWAAASHYLDYKNEHGVPAHLRKDFFALSGLFYVADTHFEMFYREAQESREESMRASPNTITDKLLNLDTFMAYLYATFPERRHCEADSVSDLLDEILAAEITKVSDLDAHVKYAEPAFKRYEKEHPPTGESMLFADVGVVRISLEMVHDKFLKVRKQKEKDIEINRTAYAKYLADLGPRK